jgi:hypothetical protein
MGDFNVSLPGGIGDIICAAAQLNYVSERYDNINISFSRHMIESFRENAASYEDFLYRFSILLFRKPKYNIILNANFIQMSPLNICQEHHIAVQRMKIDQLLCNNNFALITDPYIVITTKVRWYDNEKYQIIKLEFWKAINKLSNKYKIVIIGEKIIEMNNEYAIYGTQHIYSIYNDAITNIPIHALIDYTVPALGKTVPNLDKIREDCCIMRDAHCVITFGLGGNVAMSMSVAKYALGLRDYTDEVARSVFEDTHYEDCYIIKDNLLFLSKLNEI